MKPLSRQTGAFYLPTADRNGGHIVKFDKTLNPPMKTLPLIALLLLGIQSPDKILAPERIIKLIPGKVENFHPDGDAKSKVIKLGNIQYSMAEKNFAAYKERSIKILLFDYKEAPIMYKQATRKWSTFSTIENDSLILRPAIVTDCTGWESYNVHKKNSQIMLGVCDRFFLTLEGTNVELATLNKIVQNFKFDTFPK